MANETQFKYPGSRAALDGNSAVIMCERESTDAAGAYPITPSTQMGEYWAEETAKGHLNTSGRPLIFIEPEGEHAAAGVTAGMAMSGLRAANFSSGQGIAYMHESLYAAVGKRLTYVLNIGARAMTKANLNVHAGHDDYHCVDDTGFFQMFAKNAQNAADLNIIAHRIAELSLTPGIIAQDGFLTTHLIESLKVPERELIDEYLGHPDDMIDTPTAAQRMIYGDTRRRIPVLWDVDNPVMAGLVQNQDSYMQSVAAQRPFFFDHIDELADRAFDEFYKLTGRRYHKVVPYLCDDADYLILGQGSVMPSAEVVADYLRKTRNLKVGVVDLVMFRPFPAAELANLVRGRKGVVVLERLDQPLAVDLPVVRELRTTLAKCLENGRGEDYTPHPDLPTFTKLTDAPPIYSGSFGMGSRDLQPEGLIGAVENMLPDGGKKRFFYTSIDFVHETASSPKMAIHQDTIVKDYPHVADLAVRGSENPNLMPDGSVTVRFHSVGGWGAITTGKNLAMTLFDLLGFHIKANPKYGSEKKGQPTTYYLAAAPEPIRINCEYFYVDVVLSPDPNVFKHTNALAGLTDGGTFIIESDGRSPEEVWAFIPERYRKLIIEKKVKVFALDGFNIARAEASNPELQLRMQGNAFQGAFFSASPVGKEAGLSEAQLLEAIEAQIEAKFGSKGQRVVDDNMRIIRRGWDEVRAVPTTEVVAEEQGLRQLGPPLPPMLKRLPASEAPITDIHRFWEQTGAFYAAGRGDDQLTDPFIGLGTMPAVTSVFRDMTGIRFDHPEFIPENCTACGDCYTVCPDTAIPGLVSEVGAVFNTAIKRIGKRGVELQHVQRASRVAERHVKALFDDAGNDANVDGLLDMAIGLAVTESGLDDAGKTALEGEFALVKDELDGFQMALTRPHFTLPEKKLKGSGGLFSVTVNPYTCKGCMECVKVCTDDALISVPQTEDSIAKMRKAWDLWLDLPSTPDRFIKISNLEEGVGTLSALLLDKAHYMALNSGDGACLGCSEKTVLHLFTATVEALMQKRVASHLEYLEGLIDRLEKHVQSRLLGKLDITDPATLGEVLQGAEGQDVTLASIAEKMEEAREGDPIDQAWLKEASQLVAKLRKLRWRYLKGTTGQGRAALGMINSTGCTSVWGSTYPFNPYPYPWANHLFQDTPSICMGVFEGHMAKMADGFRAIRRAELEVSGEYDPKKHDEYLTYFNWRHFTDEEWELCPPVVGVGGDGAMYDIGFQNLSRLMMSGKPIKTVIVDTQVYSNTGGQACTSGFTGQISDMAQYGKAFQGKEEVRKEIGLIAMAHRTTYVLQGAISNANHMIEGFIHGLKARRPALFNLYTSCQPEHGIGDDMGYDQAKLAVESRAYPLFTYDPDKGLTPQECFNLDGNPDMDADWPTYTLKYKDARGERTMDLPFTFADFAMTEARFRKHFRKAPQDTWNDSMVPLHEYLDMSVEERNGSFPYIWTVDGKQQLGRLLVAEPVVLACEDRRAFWTLLKAISAVEEPVVQTDDTEARVRQETVARIAQGLMSLAMGGEGDASAMLGALAGGGGDAAAAGGNGASDAYSAPWIEVAECTACDECIKINNKAFKYNADKKAELVDPAAATFAQLVKAAELCTAGVIHPGHPRDPDAPGADKLIARAASFN